jgi:hypothetical protein
VSGIPKELEALRDELGSPEAKAAFAASNRAVGAWDRANPTTLGGVLDFIDQLRLAFGDGEPDRTPWIGDRFLID